MRFLIIAPVVVPLVTAGVALLLARRLAWQRAASLCGAFALLGSGVLLAASVWGGSIRSAQIGGWAAPFGITFVVDPLAAAMVLLTGVVAICVVIYSLADADPPRERYGYHALLHTLLMGVCGAFLTGDLFNLYVWFEVTLMASFVLLALGGERAQLEAAIKYVTINLLASAVFLAAVGLLYGVTGTLNMADLAVRVAGAPRGVVVTLSTLFLVAFGIKAGLFPLFFWLPASYHTPPAPVAALFAGLLTKVGVYALVRVFTLVFTTDAEFTGEIITAAAVLTMLAGAFGALAQSDLRRLFSFLIVAHIGVATAGLGVGTPAALAGTIYYLVEDGLALANLFLIAGVIRRLRGTYHLPRIAGLLRSHPRLGAIFLVPALSLAGVPPLAGFFAKLAIIRAALAAEVYGVVAASLVVSLLTLYAMMRVWSQAFWTPDDEVSRAGQSGGRLRLMTVSCAALAAVEVALGLGAGHFYDFTSRAGALLVEREAYIRIVLGS